MIPDFDQLGRETFWSANDWREAWDALPNHRLWDLVKELSRTLAVHPVTCALELVGVVY